MPMSPRQVEPAGARTAAFPLAPIRRWFFRIKGALVIIASLAVGGLSWLVLSILGPKKSL